MILDLVQYLDGNVCVRGGRLTQEKKSKMRSNIVVITGMYGTLQQYKGASTCFRCIMRRFSGTYVNCQYPGILAPSARRDVLPVDTGPVPSPVHDFGDLVLFLFG